MSRIVLEETCCRKLGVLSGPNLAREILAGQPAATVVASRFHEVFDAAQELLKCEQLRVYGSRDVLGVELGGALKNIIALVAGFVNGRGYGDNTKSMLITRGMAEISRFGVRLGARAETFQGLAGIGDLIATCSSPLSRNYQVGWRLAKGERWAAIRRSMVMVAEGVRTTKAVHFQARTLGIEMAITDATYRLLYTRADPDRLLRELMTRRARYESDEAEL